MEQLVARLDVAMFNAILRESADDIPTDPIADPISDADVLPIPVGKTSFGAGAQLKNAVRIIIKLPPYCNVPRCLNARRFWRHCRMQLCIIHCLLTTPLLVLTI